MTEPDVSATLDALERKLRDLERELHGVAAPPVVEPVAPSRGEGLPALAEQVDELGTYRDRLARTQRELEDEYGRMLARLESLVGAEPAAEPEPEPEASPPETWIVDAGPFADLAALGSFEQELAALGSVDVTGFEGRRAQFALWPEGPIDLVAALPSARVEVEAPGRARVEL
jgi:hypothetical protein